MHLNLDHAVMSTSAIPQDFVAADSLLSLLGVKTRKLLLLNARYIITSKLGFLILFVDCKSFTMPCYNCSTLGNSHL
jgi:hypothetical protein